MALAGMISRPIHPADIQEHWEVASVELQRAFDLCENDNTRNHYQPLCNDLEQLWEIDGGRGWAITRVMNGKSGRVFEWIALAGTGGTEWIGRFFSESEDWARSVGCTKAIFTGRKGWERLLPDYKVKRIVCEKEL